jgi:glutamine amidotransferase
VSAALVAVVDYGAGNTFSMSTALARAGASAYVVTHAAEVREGTSHVVLPGVGAFGHCLQRLRAAGLDEFLLSWVDARKPLLGVCVGLQLLCRASEETPGALGLAFVRSDVVRLAAPGYRIPHVGWNTVRNGGPDAEPLKGFAYFNHSFGLREQGSLIDVRWCDHGGGFVAEARQDSVLLAQYHPEKSQSVGERLLERFVQDPSAW